MRVIDQYPLVNPFNDMESGRVICWWSGGVASAVAGLLAYERYKEDCVFVFCDTGIEHPDTYRFMKDFEDKLGIKILTIKSDKYANPEAVWNGVVGLNFAHGAPCSMYLKKNPRLKFQKLATDFTQVFGFDYDKKEMKRATNMLVNNPDLNPIFPLIVEKLDRVKIFNKIAELGIEPPVTYKTFKNNNCIGDFEAKEGGCIQGGVGYWKLIREKFPHKFEHMASIEHRLSKQKGQPVTICKDQRKDKRGNKLFLKASVDFPDVETIDVIKGKVPVTVYECNGFCSTEEV